MAITSIVEHGVALIASGASELKPDQYFYGKDPRVVTAWIWIDG
jgi:heterodisulfide reductase subunit A2